MTALQLTLYVMGTFFSVAITVLLAVYAWRHREAPGAPGFVFLMACITVWSVIVVMEALSPTEALWQFWYNAKYLPLAVTPVAILIFALQYAGRRRWLTLRRQMALLVVPLVTQVLLWSNPLHHLWWLDGRAVVGPWFWVHSAYSFVLVFVAMTLLTLLALRAPKQRRQQSVVLIAGFTFPLLVNVAHTFNLIHYYADFTPLAFTVSGVAFAWSMYRHRLFDLTPLAREVLIDGMEDGMLVLDTQFRVADYNPAAKRILQKPDEDLTGAVVSYAIPNWMALLPQLEEESCVHAEIVLSEHNEPRYYDVRMTPLYDRQLELSGYLLLLQEITERKEAERAIQRYALALEARNTELEASNAELDAFAHTVAHDLKAPLTALVGFSQLLERRVDRWSPEQICDTASRITQTGQKMTNIIDELLLLSSVRKAEEIRTELLEMRAIVAEALDRFEGPILESGAKIVAPEAWPPAVGYGPWIEEVWVNYVSNALKYGGTPPHVELGADPPANGVVRFWCRDNGSGLTETAQAKLFAEFTRLEQTRAKGHGLGLSIVRRIVEKLGGSVGVESEAGTGSTFWFTLPSL